MEGLPNHAEFVGVPLLPWEEYTPNIIAFKIIIFAEFG